MITSGGKRKPAKLDLNAGTRRQRRRIDQSCLILFSFEATAPVVAPSRCTDRLGTSRRRTRRPAGASPRSPRGRSRRPASSTPGRAGTSAQVASVVPDRRWRYPQPPQDAADRGRSHAVTDLEQLALDSLVSPVVILSGHAFAQRGHRAIDGRTPNAIGIRPLLGDQATMPAQDRARRDQARPPRHLRQSPDERGEHRAIRPVQAGLRLALRSTATSWRNTRISMFLDVDERPSSNSRFSSRRKIK